MINQEMVTMEFNKICILIMFLGAIMLLLVAPFVSAKGMIDLEPAQVNLAQVLDKEYIVKESGAYFKDLKQDIPIVWIDKKVGTTYHVDSIKDFDKEENESVTLEFFYDIQPDWIAHYAHSGKFDRYYFPTQWEWESNCPTEDTCDGGWVTFEVYNIEEGTGSSTFPIGITGPTWARDGEFYGEFNGESSNINTSSNINLSTGFTFSVWANSNSLDTDNGFSRRIFRGNNNFRPFLGVHTTGVFEFNVANSSGTQAEILTSSVSTNTWYHLIGTYNSTSNNFTVYLNGIFNNTELLIGGIDDYNNSNLVLGLASFSQGRFDGLIDEALAYNISFTPEQALTLYNNYTLTSLGPKRTGTPSTTGLVLDINFDDFSVADVSGQANHGTNTNVSFGVVEDINITLIEDTDYSISGDTLTIINQNLVWTGMDVSWNYLQNTGTQNALNRLENNFTAGVDNVSSKIPTIFTIAAIILILTILLLLIVVFKKLSSVGEL